MTTHYHASSNVPGYLPEGDVDTFSTKRDAITSVAVNARYLREHEADQPRSQRRVGRGSAASGAIHFVRPNDTYDLGVVFWWSRCDASDCADDGEE